MSEFCTTCHKNPINESRSKIRCDKCLDKISASTRKCYIKNKERVIAYQKSYYEKNSKYIKEQSRKYERAKRARRISDGICASCGNHPIAKRSKSSCESCLENKRKRQIEYSNKTPKEKKLKSQYGAVSKKPEKYREIKRKYWENNKDKWNIYSIERRARKSSVGGSFSNDEWKSLLDKYGNKCLWCEASENIEKDHVVPISKGGSNYISNIQPLCKKCNRKKWDKILDFRPFGTAILDWT